MKQTNSHHVLVAKLNYLLIKDRGVLDAIELGDMILKLGFDNITDGFWIWQVDSEIEYYSPKFREILGYEGEQDFPSTPKSWQSAIDPSYSKAAIEAYEAHKKDPNYPYCLDVVYNRKDGKTKVALTCSGTIVNREEKTWFMIGTHEITSFFK